MSQTPAKATIYDVAERAGVSISTVSLAVNTPHRVRAETRERIVAAAAALGYRMTSDGRSGVSRIAVAAPYTSYPTYLRRLAGMLRRARSAAVDLVPYDLDSAASATAPLLESLPARADVAGLIMMGVPLGGAALRASRAARLPLAFVDIVRPTRSGASSVLVDDLAGGRMLGAHLRELGHRRVAFVHEVQRSQGYVSAGMLRADGMAEQLQLLPVASAGPDSVEADALRSAAAKGVTAFVANHDRLAAAVLKAVSGTPELADTTVTGYDDGELAEALQLTTVRQPFEETGRVALESVLERIADPSRAASRTVLEPTLVVRASSRPASARPA
ncbi:LacI family DNA-binding transcriptional regulator [Microbacterium sp. 22195]|uniref:LacI family DNA-binding transcriptional regulator n=1 Tax=Microbacterium sp. 22195 TaxID=3453891 RepID=UPI003F84A661